MTLQEKLNLKDYQINTGFYIQGTDHDRRRKLTNREIYSIKRSFENTSRDIGYLAEKYNVSPSTIRYHVDSEYRRVTNANRRNYAHNTKQDDNYKSDLADYKRYLIQSGKRLLPNT